MRARYLRCSKGWKRWTLSALTSFKDYIPFSLADLGANLRHEVAHGLVNDSVRGSVVGVYVWWLVPPNNHSSVLEPGNSGSG